MRAPHPWVGHERLQKRRWFDGLLGSMAFFFAWFGALSILGLSQLGLNQSLRSVRGSKLGKMKRGLAVGVPLSYTYSGAPVSIVVPSTATAMTVDLKGAAGGDTRGAKGGRVQATIPVTPGETLQVRVGGQGVNGSSAAGGGGGYNGGGSCPVSGSSQAGSGGGATDIRRGAFALADRIAVAGGGGGQGGNSGLDSDGHGGGLVGATSTSWGGQGGGGTQSAGGAGGPSNGNQGTLGQGGAGVSASGYNGGGGGGGYYGGGGGSSSGSNGSGRGGDGGGGSSYTDPTAVNIVHTQGYGAKNSDGVAIVTFLTTMPTLPTGITEVETTIKTPGSDWVTESAVKYHGGATRNNATGVATETYVFYLAAPANVKLYGLKFNSGSTDSRISVDGGAESSFSARNATEVPQTLLYDLGTLAAGLHTVTLRDVSGGSFAYLLPDYWLVT